MKTQIKNGLTPMEMLLQALADEGVEVQFTGEEFPQGLSIYNSYKEVNDYKTAIIEALPQGVDANSVDAFEAMRLIKDYERDKVLKEAAEREE